MSPDLTALHVNFHSNVLDSLPTLPIRKNFRCFFHSIYLWIGWSTPWLKVVLLFRLVASLLSGQHWRFQCWYPQNLHSGHLRAGSHGLHVFGGGSVLTAPTDSSVPLIMNFNCWLVCSEALQMLIALVKVRSFTRKRSSLIFSSQTPRTKRSHRILSGVISSWAQFFAITHSLVTYALMPSPGSCLQLKGFEQKGRILVSDRFSIFAGSS